jgi:hypothetical protein
LNTHTNFSLEDDGSLFPQYQSNFKKAELSRFDELVMRPAFDMKRYTNLKIDDDVRRKIFGKKKAHEVKALIEAGMHSYPAASDKIWSIAMNTQPNFFKMKQTMESAVPATSRSLN